MNRSLQNKNLLALEIDDGSIDENMTENVLPDLDCIKCILY